MPKHRVRLTPEQLTAVYNTFASRPVDRLRDVTTLRARVRKILADRNLSLVRPHTTTIALTTIGSVSIYRATDPGTEKSRKGLQAYPPDAVITVLVDRNPKQGKSRARFDLYRTGMTIAEYGEAVRNRRYAVHDIHWDIEYGHISVTLPDGGVLRRSPEASR